MSAQSQDLREVRDLIYKPILSFEDRVRLARMLSIHLSDDSITPHNIFETGSDTRFMQKHYPDERYVPGPLTSGSLCKYGHSVASLCKGDVKSVLSEMLHTATTRGVVDKVVSLVGRKGGKESIRSEVERTKRTAVALPDPKKVSDREEIRTLTLRRAALNPSEKSRLIALLRSRYRKGNVDETNYIHVSLDFLKIYYPKDFANEKTRAMTRKQFTSRSPLQERNRGSHHDHASIPSAAAAGPLPVPVHTLQLSSSQSSSESDAPSPQISPG